MESNEIGSIIMINGKHYEIIDSWVGSKTIKTKEENSIIDVEYVNLKDEHGKIIGPVELNTIGK
jgi:hypothetical protein